MGDKIKGLRKKIGSNSYASLIPFGTDGELVDMKSGLMLEDNLILGGNHSVSISEDDSGTLIEELYKDLNDDDVYKVETQISESEQGTEIEIKMYIYNTDTSSFDLYKEKNITIEESGNIVEIEETLEEPEEEEEVTP